MTQTTTAGFYVIKQDEDGNVLLFLPQPEGSAENPLVIYDGKEHALLVRNAEQKVILDYVNPEMRRELLRVLSVIVVEVKGAEIVDHYVAGMRRVDQIPVDWKSYGLGTWEEALTNKTVTGPEVDGKN